MTYGNRDKLCYNDIGAPHRLYLLLNVGISLVCVKAGSGRGTLTTKVFENGSGGSASFALRKFSVTGMRALCFLHKQAPVHYRGEQGL